MYTLQLLCSFSSVRALTGLPVSILTSIHAGVSLSSTGLIAAYKTPSVLCVRACRMPAALKLDMYNAS